MAHYDAHRNRGYDGYGIKKPVYGGRPAAIVAYSASSESYVASSEQVVTYGDYTTRPDRHDQVWPRSSARAQLKKGDEYDHSPRFGQANGSPRKTFHSANSPPTGHFSSVYAPHLDSPRKNFRDDHSSAYGARLSSPHDSPGKNFRNSRGGRFSSSDDDDSSDDEVECRDGVCYPKAKHGGGGGQGYDYDKEKNKTNGYAAGNYPLQQHSTDHQPRKDPYHQTSNAEKMPNGNNIYGSHSYNAPAQTKPMTDAYYDRYSYPATNNDHNYTHSRNEPYVVPAPIKTRPDRGEGGRSSPVSAVAQWTPFATSPKKGHQGRPEVIDSTEAQRRHGNASRMHGAAIDSETAAKKYGGVFVK